MLGSSPAAVVLTLIQVMRGSYETGATYNSRSSAVRFYSGNTGLPEARKTRKFDEFHVVAHDVGNSMHHLPAWMENNIQQMAPPKLPSWVYQVKRYGLHVDSAHT